VSSKKRRRIAYSQNFLKFSSLARRIVRKSSISHDDVVLEVGPGKGILTGELARAAREVIAVEKDPNLARSTRTRLSNFENIEIVETDFFDFPLPCESFKVFASVPFNTTAAIVRRLTDAANAPVDSYLIVQREAAERFIGEPVTTLQAVLLSARFDTEVIHRFRRNDFHPAPRVDSVLLRIRRLEVPLVPTRLENLFRDFVAYGFTAWQPDLRTAFRRVLCRRDLGRLHARGLDLSHSPSQLPIDHWIELFDYFVASVPARRRKLVAGAHRRLERQQAKLSKSHRTRGVRR
jgi:23S rRNA (adenine-N6)-dimethyltransferase